MTDIPTLDYYYHENCLVPCAVILIFFSSRFFIVKSLFFKNLNRATSVVIWVVLAFLFLFCSCCTFYSPYLTENGVKSHGDVPAEMFGAENLNDYLDGNRLVTPRAAARLRAFFREREHSDWMSRNQIYMKAAAFKTCVVCSRWFDSCGGVRSFDTL